MTALKVGICHPSFVWGDAIGHDSVGMYRLLKTFGMDPTLVCAAHVNLPPDVCVTPFDQLDKGTLGALIYHHSQHWAGGEQLLAEAECPLLLRYHNITPA